MLEAIKVTFRQSSDTDDSGDEVNKPNWLSCNAIRLLKKVKIQPIPAIPVNNARTIEGDEKRCWSILEQSWNWKTT